MDFDRDRRMLASIVRVNIFKHMQNIISLRGYPGSFPLLLIAVISVFLAIIFSYCSFLLIASIIVCIFLIAVLIKRPEWLLYFIAFSRVNLDAIKVLNPEIVEKYVHWALSFDGIISAAVLLLGGCYLAKNRKAKIFQLPAAKPYLGFLIICFISLFFSSDKIVGIRNFLQYLIYFIIYILIVNVLDSRDKNYKMIFTVLLSSLIPLLAGFYQAITASGDLTATPGLNRIYATLNHPNPYSYYLMIMLIFCLTVFFYATSIKYKVSSFALIIPISLSLILTYSRAGWLGSLLGLAIFLLMLLFRDLNFKKLIALIGILFVISILIACFRFQILGRIFSLQTHNLDTLGFRFAMWGIYLERFMRSPLIGHGLGSSVSIAGEEMGYLILPHNDYVRLLVEVGVVGLCSYLAALISLVIYFLRKHKRSLFIRGNILSAGVVALTFSVLLVHTSDSLISCDAAISYFWIFIAVAYNLLI